MRETLALLDGFDAGDDSAVTESVARTRRLLEESDRPFDRANYAPGHVTASGLVLAPDGRAALVVFHRRLARWLQPGGHIEPYDPSVVAAAAREVGEETGVPLAAGEAALVTVDVHEIPRGKGEPLHDHHDLMFAFRATSDRLAPGAHRARWLLVREARTAGADAAFVRALERTLGWWVS